MNKYVLRISCYFHDSSVSLIKNGKIISAVQEERFTGIKGDSSFPSRSIEWCLNINNLKVKIKITRMSITLDKNLNNFINSNILIHLLYFPDCKNMNKLNFF